MADKIREFLFGRVVLEGFWTALWRFAQIFVVGSILFGIYHQFFGG